MTALAIIALLAITADFGARVYAYAVTGDPKFKHEHFVWWRG